jgi:hypothetical protein
MLFLWVKILHQNIFSLHLACKDSFFLTSSIQILLRKNHSITSPPPTSFQVKRSVPKDIFKSIRNHIHRDKNGIISYIFVRSSSYHNFVI